MARKHFHSIDINCTSSELSDENVSFSHPEYVARRKRFLAPHDMVLRARCLLGFIDNALRDAKVTTTSPKITELRINLTNVPREQPDYYRGGERWDLNVDVACSATSLVKLPMDHKILGEFFIDIVEQGLEKASEYPELPRDIINEACTRFRANDYKFPYKIGEGKIEGTAVKGRLQAVASCVSTERYFSAAYRGKDLFRTQISGTDTSNLGLRTLYNGFAWADDIITVKGSPWLEDADWAARIVDHAKPYNIHLNAFPEAMAFIQTKLV